MADLNILSLRTPSKVSSISRILLKRFRLCDDIGLSGIGDKISGFFRIGVAPEVRGLAEGLGEYHSNEIGLKVNLGRVPLGECVIMLPAKPLGVVSVSLVRMTDFACLPNLCLALTGGE